MPLLLKPAGTMADDATAADISVSLFLCLSVSCASFHPVLLSPTAALAGDSMQHAAHAEPPTCKRLKSNTKEKGDTTVQLQHIAAPAAAAAATVETAAGSCSSKSSLCCCCICCCSTCCCRPHTKAINCLLLGCTTNI